jgi:hypothetical protein
MCRPCDALSRDACGRVVAPCFCFCNAVTRSVTARSKMTAMSPFGMTWRNRSWATRSLSYVSRETVNCTLYCAGASGLISATRRAGLGTAAGPGASCRVAVSSTSRPDDRSRGAAADFAVGSFRTVGGTGGCGRSVATSCSTSRLLFWCAAASTRSWFSGVRCGASRHTAVRCSDPLASRSRMMGNFRAARAASIRPYAACSDKWRVCVQ